MNNLYKPKANLFGRVMSKVKAIIVFSSFSKRKMINLGILIVLLSGGSYLLYRFRYGADTYISPVAIATTYQNFSGGLWGNVSSPDGSPLGNVSLVAGSTNAKTDAIGNYYFDNIDPGNYTILFFKNDKQYLVKDYGYGTQIVVHSGATPANNFVLVPADPARVTSSITLTVNNAESANINYGETAVLKPSYSGPLTGDCTIRDASGAYNQTITPPAGSGNRIGESLTTPGLTTDTAYTLSCFTQYGELTDTVSVNAMGTVSAKFNGLDKTLIGSEGTATFTASFRGAVQDCKLKDNDAAPTNFDLVPGGTAERTATLPVSNIVSDHIYTVTCQTHGTTISSMAELDSLVPNINAYWKMDDAGSNIISDLSANHLNGTATGTHSSAGKFGQSREWSDLSHFITIPTNDKLELSKNSSIVFWYAEGTLDPNLAYDLINKNNDSYNHWRISRGLTGKIVVNIATQDGTNYGGADITSSQVVADQSWHQVVVTRDGGNLKLYFDGRATGEANNTSIADVATSGTSNLIIGGRVAGWKGKIDDLLLLDRTLSPADVTALYQGTLRP